MNSEIGQLKQEYRKSKIGYEKFKQERHKILKCSKKPYTAILTNRLVSDEASNSH